MRVGMSRAVPAILATLAAAAAVWQGSATQAAPGPPVLHEPLPPAAGSAPRTDQTDDTADPLAGSGDALPEAILTSLGRIEKPKAGGDGVPTYQAKPPPHVGIDRRTGADLDLHYQVVFDPTVAPFKREVAFDTVQPDLTLSRSGAGRQPLSTGQLPRAGHELFWGHLRLVLRGGAPVVLPSVAPTSQILSWQASPALPLHFWRDRAGNFEVSSDTDGDVDLRFLMDAPSEYFAAPLGTWSGADDPDKPKLDPDLRARVQALWEPLGVSPTLERGATVAKLVEYFRGFEPGMPPSPSGDALADLVLSRKGVCRHRALGFLIVAHSLGISAHYVMNDAHAFIEAWVPALSGRGQWQRIDLGGGSESLELHAATGKRLHQPQFRDPFARPEAYTSQTGQVRIDGVPVPQTFGGAGKLKGADGLAGADVGPAMSGMPPDATAREDGDARRSWLRQRAEALSAPRLAPAAARAQPQPGPTRSATQLRLEPMAALGWLGEPVRVAGQLSAQDGARQLAVELWMIDPSRPTQGRLLGVLPTDDTGHFSGELPIPADLDPQVYDIVARFAGDPKRAPSDSGP